MSEPIEDDKPTYYSIFVRVVGREPTIEESKYFLDAYQKGMLEGDFIIWLKENVKA